MRYYCKQDQNDPNSKKDKNEKIEDKLKDTEKKKNVALEKLLSKMKVNLTAGLDISSKPAQVDTTPKAISKPAKKPNEKTLLNELLNLNVNKSVSTQDLILQMVVHKEKPETQQGETSYDEKPKYSKKRSPQYNRNQTNEAVRLFDHEPLNIFNVEDLKQPVDHLQTWKELEWVELQLSIFQPPSNYFSKMVMLTQNGLAWKFPIDNEQDIVVKENFSEHIFLEGYLDWCEKKGPVRRFMDLVITGLSKNPYLTIAEKKEHIEYYRKYFESRASKAQQLN